MFQSLRVKKGKFSHDWPLKRVFFCIVALRRWMGKFVGAKTLSWAPKRWSFCPVHNFCRISALRRCKLAPKRHPFCPNVLFCHISAPKRYEWAPKRYVCCLFHHKLSKTFQIIDFHLSFKQRTKTHIKTNKKPRNQLDIKYKTILNERVKLTNQIPPNLIFC